MNTSTVRMRDEGERLGLRQGEMYRVSYAVGTPQHRRVTRSLVVYAGAESRRLWDGRESVCFEFERPRGRALSLLRAQIIEVRPATLNERGQLVLVDQPGSRRRRVSRRFTVRAAW